MTFYGRGCLLPRLTGLSDWGPLPEVTKTRPGALFLTANLAWAVGCASSTVIVDGSGGTGGGGGASASTASLDASSSTLSGTSHASTSTGIGTTSVATSSASTGTSSSQCTGDPDCPATGNECTIAKCETSECKAEAVAAGTATTELAAAGSCQKKVCDGQGAVKSIADDSNVPTSSDPCKTAGCSGGAPTSGNTGDGTACSGGQCISGSCKACGASTQPACLQGNACAVNLSPVLDGQSTSTSGAAAEPTTCQCGQLSMGQEIDQTAGRSVLVSCDGRFNLVMQSDNNLVLYYGSTALWGSNTQFSGAAYAIMQTDGNFVLYGEGGGGIWSSNTAGYPGAYLALQNDGNLVVYYGSSALWSTKTCCH